ncbi:hypothetical protein F3N42_14805 [Marinihelvus fidelis]|uniref:Uncharacterized protein n=1 Tax=Marinihelvus fidelis TaxID=2613842 RepID=A0A5N0T450_9GAMM|nr:hypothetical protein [Marinihelvus fidelis]KAA9129631.1 hypothetical protein F3N42_14805 [Marinihelvus fidelis]
MLTRQSPGHRIGLFFRAIVCLSVTLSADVLACMCAPVDAQDLWNGADVIIQATVSRSEWQEMDCKTGTSGYQCKKAQRIEVTTAHVVKGEWPTGTPMFTGGSAYGCGAAVEEGKTYLFFPGQEASRFWLSACDHPAIEIGSMREYEFRQSLRPEPPPSQPLFPDKETD